MRPEPMWSSGRCALVAPTVEVCLLSGVWSDLTSWCPPFSVPPIIFLDTTPQIQTGWMGQMRPG